MKSDGQVSAIAIAVILGFLGGVGLIAGLMLLALSDESKPEERVPAVTTTVGAAVAKAPAVSVIDLWQKIHAGTNSFATGPSTPVVNAVMRPDGSAAPETAVPMVPVEPQAGPPVQAPVPISVVFKVDRRRGGRQGSAWIPLPSLSLIRASTEVTVETKAQMSRAGSFRMTDVDAEWVPTDPEMVSVMPSQRSRSVVAISVRRAGECSLRIASQGSEITLRIKASHEEKGMHVVISQE